jgi:thiosulfate/3-mercaptopyruvate sulfurtransferase
LAFNTLIDTDELAAHAADSRWITVDCRFLLADEAWGEHEYLIAHIPGAVYAHLNRDLSGSLSGTNGRHPLPDADALTQTFIRLGIGSGMQVVAYDQGSGMFASRLWWLLRWMGHESVAVLDGGFRRWAAERRPVATGHDARPPQRFTGAPRHDMTVDAKAVAGILERRGALLVDARAPERYRGDIEPLDRTPGHIPGAVNHFFEQNLDEHGAFRSKGDLRERLSATIRKTPPHSVVCYCGSGVTACHNLLAMEVAGMHGAKLYPGSWSEWSSDPSRPVERGEKEKGPAL